MVIGTYKSLHIIDSKGKWKSMLTVPDEADPEKQLGDIWDIAVSSEGYILVLDSTKYVKKYVKVFTNEGKYHSCFSTLTANDDPGTRVSLRFITIDKEGRVLVGDRFRGIITLHSCPDGEIVNTMKYEWNPTYKGSISVNSKEQILHHFTPTGELGSRVEAIDYTGDEVFSFLPQIEKNITDRKVCPGGIVCDTHDNIYVAMCSTLKDRTGHVHKHSLTGEFMECIVDGLHHPLGLSITTDNSSLVIANDNSVLVYSLNTGEPCVPPEYKNTGTEQGACGVTLDHPQ